MMKKLIFIMLLLSGSFMSCNDTLESNEPQPDLYSMDLVTDQQIINNVKNWVSDNMSSKVSKKNVDIEFDFNKIYSIKTDVEGVMTLTVKAKSYENNNDKWAIGFIGKMDQIESVFITKQTLVSGKIKEIEYYNINFDLLLKVEVNGNEEKINVLYRDKKNAARVTGSGCGQDVMDCITMYYSEMGWGSVGLTLLSIAAPEVVVGIAAGCTLAVC